LGIGNTTIIAMKIRNGWDLGFQIENDQKTLEITTQLANNVFNYPVMKNLAVLQISSEDQTTIDFIKGKGIVNSEMVVASI
jgi:hypothetical protein